jgi:hypothetical protein
MSDNFEPLVEAARGGDERAICSGVGATGSSGKDAVVATMRSSGTWDGQPRPGRYRIVPAPMNGEPAAWGFPPVLA